MSHSDDAKEAFAKRVSEVLDERGYPDRGRAQRIKREGGFDISDRAINKWLSGETMPDHHNLELLAKYLGVNFNWLAAGQGDKAVKPSIQELQQKIDSINNKDKQTPMFAGQQLARPVDSGIAPVISWVAAGSWASVDSVTMDDVIKTVPIFDGMPPNVFGLIVQGISMMPRFKPTDIIYVDPNVSTLELINGDLVVVQCNDGADATFKELVIGESANDMYLRPLNPDWHEQKLLPIGECTLVGKVIKKVEDV